MDGIRFDSLTRALTAAGSRRGALSGLLAGALGLLGVRSEDAAAHNPKAKCKKKSGDAKKKCLKKAKKHNAQHAAEATVPPPPPPPSTCSAPDNIKNGSETGVDCGGPCPRCATGQDCASRNDCTGAFCSGGTCQTCTIDTDCPNDASGTCECLLPILLPCPPPTGGCQVGPRVCLQSRPTKVGSNCSMCDPDEVCSTDTAQFTCHKRCGTS